MSNNDGLDHAKHNKEVCEYLSREPKYSDWVITTAFYSAIHFTDHKIFPRTVTQNGKKINFTNFDYYYFFYKSTTKKPKNQHKVRSELVEKYLPEISHQYKRLKDLCHNARYVDYNFDHDIAKQAKEECLVEIENFCVGK